MENSGTKAAICQVNFGLLQKQFPHVFLLFHFCFLFFFSVPVSFFSSFLSFVRPPELTTFTNCLSTTVPPSSQHRKSKKTAAAAARNSSRSRSSSTDGTANFWSFLEPIPTSYSGDLGFFGKLSPSTIVFQLESLRSVSGSSRNQG